MTMLILAAEFALTLSGYLLPSVNLETGYVTGGCYDVVVGEWMEVTPC